MSVTINASTSAGLIQTADTSGTVEIQSNGTTRLTVASGGVTANNLTATGTFGGGVITAGTAVTLTNQTSVDYTNIPSWVKRITVMFSGVSSNGTSNYQILLGTGGTPTYTTSGYLGEVSTDTAVTRAVMSTSFQITIGTASGHVYNGNIYINLLGSNIWCENGMIYRSESIGGCTSAGSVPLAATLTAIRLTTVNGTDQFDAGTINILYEG